MMGRENSRAMLRASPSQRADIIRLVLACRRFGYEITRDEAHDAWAVYSEHWGVDWLDIPLCDELAYEIIYRLYREAG